MKTLISLNSGDVVEKRIAKKFIYKVVLQN